MHWIDAVICIAYMVMLLVVGFYFLRKNEDAEDYFVSGRSMTRWHIGLSVVATDVGGGFSIGLGGLGFTMGISGSWMLFTGLLGAWLSAVWLIPRVYPLGRDTRLLTFPQIFGHFYNARVALWAGVISAIGYLGFTSSQILAGAKLASAGIHGLDLQTALWVMGAVTVLYTVLGGIKAVIYTDTIQWAVLMGGLLFVGIPVAYTAVGGYEAIAASVPESFLRLNHVSWQQLVNWAVTIIPIWFVGMTLYQRIYACRSEEEARKAWFIAGWFEWPLMAFMGVLLGLFARVGAEQGLFAELGFASAAGMDAEMGLPLLLRTVLPVGLIGIMLSVYFSAILSTADSCLMAASGNILTDILGPSLSKRYTQTQMLRLSQFFTLGLGLVAIFIASMMENVLNLMLYSYAFMVSGLLVPLVASVFFGQRHAPAALTAMIGGGLTTVILTLKYTTLPLGLDANIFGLSTSLILYILVTLLIPPKKSGEGMAIAVG
jgi:SSS family solute:Na+ symporter